MMDVTLYEVGPRDGLQNHPVPVPTADKLRLIGLLQAAGLTHIEVASFVNPKLVPQMADGAEVLAGIHRRDGDVYGALAPNPRGAEAALAAGCGEVAVFVSASETFARRNTNCTIAEGMARARAVAELASARGTPVRGYVSCVTDCPYEGAIAPEVVARLACELVDIGCREVSLGDTIGRGTPETVDGLLRRVTAEVTPGRLAGHFHDTSGRALANVRVALDHGLRVFDASVAGLGGCPFAPGAGGNLETARAVGMLHAAGFDTGVNPAALQAATDFAAVLGTLEPAR